MLTQSCAQCHKQYLADESLYDAKGRPYCSTYCLKSATGKPVAPQLPPKKSIPLMPVVLVLALAFGLFWRILAPGEVVQSRSQEPLDLTRSDTEIRGERGRTSSTSLDGVPEQRPADLEVDAAAVASTAPTESVSNPSAEASPQEEDSEEVRALALARQAALLFPLDDSRAFALAQESVALAPNREAYRVMIHYTQAKGRTSELENYSKACLALSADRRGVDYCYFEKPPEPPESETSEDNLFAPLPEPKLEPARQVEPPALGESP